MMPVGQLWNRQPTRVVAITPQLLEGKWILTAMLHHLWYAKLPPGKLA